MKIILYFTLVIGLLISSGCSSVAKKSDGEQKPHSQLSVLQITQVTKLVSHKLMYQCQLYFDNEQWLQPEQLRSEDKHFILQRIAVDMKQLRYRISSKSGQSLVDLSIEKEKHNDNKICQYRLQVLAEPGNALIERIDDIGQWHQQGGEQNISLYMQNPAIYSTNVTPDKIPEYSSVALLFGLFGQPILQALFYGISGG